MYAQLLTQFPLCAMQNKVFDSALFFPSKIKTNEYCLSLWRNDAIHMYAIFVQSATVHATVGWVNHLEAVSDSILPVKRIFDGVAIEWLTYIR